MKNEFFLFSYEQGNLLIRLLIAHIIGDFVLQTNKMVENKKWFSRYMLLHITIVFTSTLVLSGLWKISISIAVLHWLVDSIKVEMQSRNKLKPNLLFAADQSFHFIIITTAWFWYFNMLTKIFKTISIPFVNYQFSLILLAYIWLIYPVGYMIKFATQSISHTKATLITSADSEANVEHGGKLIGQFERIIILCYTHWGIRKLFNFALIFDKRKYNGYF